MRTFCTYLGPAGHRAVVFVTVPDEQHLNLLFDVPAHGDVGDDLIIVDEQLATPAAAQCVAVDWACEHAFDETTVEFVRRADGPTGEQREVARYEITDGERIVAAQRINGLVCVSDIPAGPEGRVFLIQQGVMSLSELEGLVADYVEESERLDAPARHAPGDLVEALMQAAAA